jgi:hypothetical protein
MSLLKLSPSSSNFGVLKIFLSIKSKGFIFINCHTKLLESKTKMYCVEIFFSKTLQILKLISPYCLKVFILKI